MEYSYHNGLQKYTPFVREEIYWFVDVKSMVTQPQRNIEAIKLWKVHHGESRWTNLTKSHNCSDCRCSRRPFFPSIHFFCEGSSIFRSLACQFDQKLLTSIYQRPLNMHPQEITDSKGTWYGIIIHCEYVHESHSKHVICLNWTQSLLSQQMSNGFRFDFELLNLQHVPATERIEKKDCTRKMCIQMKCIFRINGRWFDSCRRHKTFIL